MSFTLTFEQAGLEKKVQVGDAMELDGIRRSAYFCELLTPCDDWDRADFRVPMTALKIMVAVNVTITGHKVHHVPYTRQWKARAKFHFPGDGEPDTYAKGWVYFHRQID